MLGAIDGIIAESLSTDKDALGSWLGDCLKSFELPQTKAIFEKELKENPEEWHAPAAIILKSKFEEICGKE